MVHYPKMESFGNKFSLADQKWENENGGLVVRSIFKMVPAVHAFNPQKKYMVTLNNGISYKGLFQRYIYRKERIDSPLIRVYIDLKLEEGTTEFPEDMVETFFRVE